MQFKSLVPALAVALGVSACGEFVPTAPDTLETEVSYDRGAIVDPFEPIEDANENGFICVKIVPASDNAAGNASTRVIYKDDTDGRCPGGFERVPVGDGPQPG